MVSLKVVKNKDYYESLKSKEVYEKYYSENNTKTSTLSGSLLSEIDNIEEIIDKLASDNNRRLGLDITYSAPKSISVLSVLFDNNKIIEAHQKAVEEANKFIERNFLYTRDYNRHVKATAGAFLNYTHMLNRSNDPQLHTHVLCINAVKREKDGKISHLEATEIYKNQKLISQVYKNTFSKELQKMGFGVRMKDKEGNFEIKDFPEELIEEFSSRKREIDEAMENLFGDVKGHERARLREMIALTTRKHKKKMDRAELIEDWEERIKERGYEIESLQNLGKEGKIEKADLEEYIRKSYEIIHENQSVFKKEEIYNIALKLSLSESEKEIATIEEIEKAFNALVEKGEIEELDEGYYTTKKIREIEHEGINIVKELSEKGLFEKIKDSIVETEMYELRKGYRLTSNQKEVVKAILEEGKALTVIQGDAGTGKTSCFECVKEILKRRGWVIKGIAPTGKAVEELEKVGIESKTIDSFLLSDIQKGEKELWIIDESGMGDVKKMVSLLELAKKRGAKVVMSGDVKQLKSVGAGNFFENVIQNTQHVELTEKIRQVTEDYKTVVDKFSRKRFAEVTASLLKNLNIIEDTHERLERIKDEFINSNIYKTLIVSKNNKEVDILNREIREELKNKGILKKKGRTFEVLTSKNISAEEKRYSFVYDKDDTVFLSRKGMEEMGITSFSNEFVITERGKDDIKVKSREGRVYTINIKEYGQDLSLYKKGFIELTKGDRVFTLKNDKKLGVKNGQSWIVQSVKGQVITLKNSSGKTVSFDIKKYNYLNYAYASTVHKSQGATIDKIIINCTRDTNYNEFYTSLTRGKIEYSIYTYQNKDDFIANIKKLQEKYSSLDKKKKVINLSSLANLIKRIRKNSMPDNMPNRGLQIRRLLR